jgi:hypothetical protein
MTARSKQQVNNKTLLRVAFPGTKPPVNERFHRIRTVSTAEPPELCQPGTNGFIGCGYSHVKPINLHLLDPRGVSLNLTATSGSQPFRQKGDSYGRLSTLG